MHLRIATEPGPLPFGVPAGFEFRRQFRLLARKRSTQMLNDLLITQRFKGFLCTGASVGEQSHDFFDQTVMKHFLGSRIQNFI